MSDQISDFVKRHPHGLDYTPDVLPKRKQGPRNFIPAYAQHIWMNMQFLRYARGLGYSAEEVEEMRKILYEPELVLVSIDEE